MNAPRNTECLLREIEEIVALLNRLADRLKRDAAEHVPEANRLWFAKHPDRNMRVRKVQPGELSGNSEGETVVLQLAGGLLLLCAPARPRGGDPFLWTESDQLAHIMENMPARTWYTFHRVAH